MTNYEMLVEMVNSDKFLYKTICDVVGDETPTPKVYEIWCKLHAQEHWKVEDIEVMFNVQD